MNEHTPGQVVRFFGAPVTIRSVHIRQDGGISYLVEAKDGSFFRARHKTLTIPSIAKIYYKKVVPFEVICMRAANLRAGKRN